MPENIPSRPLDTGLLAYKVGGGKRLPHWSHPFHVDRWFRSWQGESDSLVWCPRAWTKAGALRRARRWYRTGADIRRHETRYGKKPWMHQERRMTIRGTVDSDQVDRG